jgi:hypothetical protein
MAILPASAVAAVLSPDPESEGAEDDDTDAAQKSLPYPTHEPITPPEP